MTEKAVLRKSFGPAKEQVRAESHKLLNVQLHNFCSSLHNNWIIK
jgi:hypothetical protein